MSRTYVILGRSEDIEPIVLGVTGRQQRAEAIVSTMAAYDQSYPKPLGRQDATKEAADQLQREREAWEANHPAGRTDLDQFWYVTVPVL